MDRVAVPQKMLGTGIYFQKPPVPGFFPAAVDPKDRRCKTVPLLRPRPTSFLRSFKPLPHSRLKAITGLAAASERRALVWHGYGASSAHHGEVRGCRRACERNPLRGRRRCAAGGRLLKVTHVTIRCLTVTFSLSHLAPPI
jgi:hypothetical protein